MAEPFTFQPQTMRTPNVSLEISLTNSQWEAIQQLLSRQAKIYEEQMNLDIDIETYHGVKVYRQAVCNLSNEIEAAKKKV